MTSVTDTNVITIDATGQVLGKVAGEAAIYLRGKDLPSYAPNTFPQSRKVQIINANKLKLEDNRLAERYTHNTGFPGGLRYTSRAKVIEKKGIAEVVRRAVFGMLPNNRLRKPMLKQLEVVES